MAVDLILVEASPGEVRAALLDHDILVRYAVARDGDGPRAGDVVLGRVVAVSAAADAAFVDLGHERPGFLGLSDARPAGAEGGRISDFVCEGDSVVAAVLRAPDGEKGAKLRRCPPPAGATVPPAPPATLARGPDPVTVAVREADLSVDAPILVNDRRTAAALRAALPDLADRVETAVRPASLFAAHGADEQIHALLRPAITLPSGGAVTVTPTPALVAVDVDIAKASAGGAAATALAVNLEAAEAVARRLRAADLSGYVVIDVVPMRRRDHREAVLDRLRRVVADDARGVDVGGYTRLGRIELNRRRAGPSLVAQLTVACPACEGLGRVDDPGGVALGAMRAVLAEDRAAPGRRWQVTATPAVIAALQGPLAAALHQTEDRLGRPLRLVADPAAAADRVHIGPAAQGGQDGGV